MSSKKIKEDPYILSSPLSLKGGKVAGNKSLTVSKFFDFNDLRLYKSYNNTFNDFMLAVISKAFKRIFKKNDCTKVKTLVATIPVNVKPLPRSLEEIPFDNNVGAAKFELQLLDEINE